MGAHRSSSICTRVLVVEDAAGLRAAVAAALASAGIDVEVCARGEEALVRASSDRHDVALVDLGLPGISGIETIRQLSCSHPELRILVHTVFEEPATIVDAIRAGASGYILKGNPLEELIQAVRDVKDGLAPISPAVARHVVEALRSAPPPTPPATSHLTDREREVLALLVDGLSYPDIAAHLGIGLGTVQTHLKNVYRKLEVTTKAQAAALAVQHGLVKR